MNEYNLNFMHVPTTEMREVVKLYSACSTSLWQELHWQKATHSRTNNIVWDLKWRLYLFRRSMDEAWTSWCHVTPSKAFFVAAPSNQPREWRSMPLVNTQWMDAKILPRQRVSPNTSSNSKYFTLLGLTKQIIIYFLYKFAVYYYYYNYIYLSILSPPIVSKAFRLAAAIFRFFVNRPQESSPSSPATFRPKILNSS